MKELFPGYNRKSETELQQLWSDCIFVFDANVLTSLYRYSEATKDSFLKLITGLSDRVWLPHQAALEFNNLRYETIATQQKVYRKYEEDISKMLEEVKNNTQSPFFSSSTIESLETAIEKLKEEVHGTVSRFSNYYKHDPIYEKIVNLFDKKITEEYGSERLQEIYREGQDRYNKLIPPGFADAKAKHDDTKFGDLVIWYQIIDLSSKLNKNIIFISDDKKVDWYWKLSDGKTMGPRHELVAEIRKKANVDFHLYTSDSFLQFGQEFLNQDINDKASKEIKALNETSWHDKNRSLIETYKISNAEYDANRNINFIGKLLENKRSLDRMIDEKLVQLDSHRNSEHHVTDELINLLHMELNILFAEREILEDRIGKIKNESNFPSSLTMLKKNFKKLYRNESPED